MYELPATAEGNVFSLILASLRGIRLGRIKPLEDIPFRSGKIVTVMCAGVQG